MQNLPLSIVIPVYNSSKTISRLVDQLIQFLTHSRFQVILVNDGSRDESGDLCIKLAQKYPFITYIHLSRNFGEHNAVMAGLNYAEGDYTVIMDDDFQNPPEEILRLVKEATKNKFDIVYAVYKKKHHPFVRNLGSVAVNALAVFLLKKPNGLYLSSFKCLSKSVARRIIQYKGPFPYVDALALRCTRNIGQLQCKHNERHEGRSGYTVRKLIFLWAIIFFNFSVHPVRLFFMIGLWGGLAGVGAWAMVKYISSPISSFNSWPSGPAAVFFSYFILGFLGGYAGWLMMRQNKNPQFIIKEILNGRRAA